MFKANYATKISIRVDFLRMLTKVNCWSILKAKMQNAVQTHTECLCIRADHAPSLI